MPVFAQSPAAEKPYTPLPIPGPPDYSAWTKLIGDKLNAGAVGYAWCVYKDGKKVAGGAYGWARAPWETEDASRPMTIDSRTGIASVSKTITAAALMKLWEEGKFNLDEPFWPYLKRVIPTATPEAKKVTFRQLLTHRSGLNATARPRGRSHEALIGGVSDLMNQPADFPADSQQKYNNGNFHVVRLLVEEISGEPYSEFVQKNIFDPMDIYRITNKADDQPPTLCYEKGNFTKTGRYFPGDYSQVAGPDGWFASARDIARYIDALSQGKALKKETIQKMWQEGLGWFSHNLSKYGTYYNHNGQWNTNAEGGVILNAGHFSDGSSAAIIITCRGYNTRGVLVGAFDAGFAKYETATK